MEELQSVENEREKYQVNGGKILVFGDLHLSSTYSGKHRDYLYDCYTTMELILQHVQEENPSAIFFLGDLIGVTERNIKDRQFLMRVVMFFGKLYSITKGNVYSVKGNHDIGDFSDFDFLMGLGYIKNPLYVDYRGDNGVEVRFHFVNYGDEHQQLYIAPEDVSNIVLGHADYYIDGVTSWYSAKDGIELKKLKNFCGVDLVFSGHIHTPSQEMLYTALPNGETVGLFYVGSPSRTSERFDDCWYVTFLYSPEEQSTNYDAKLMCLPPSEEVFFPKSDFIGEDDEEEEEDEQTHKSEALNVIINEILNSRIASGDMFRQIDIIPADEDVKTIAKTYLKKAIEEVK